MNESDRVGVHKFERDASRLEAWRVSESPVLDSGAEGGGPQVLLLGGVATTGSTDEDLNEVLLSLVAAMSISLVYDL